MVAIRRLANVKSKTGLAGFVLGLCIALTGCQASTAVQTLTVYSSRTQSLVQPVLEQFAKETGINLRMKYDTSASIVATLQEEGQNSPADVVYLAETSGLGALSQREMLAALPANLLDQVDQRFRSSKGEWVGISGRSKTLVYNTKTIDPSKDLATSVMDYVNPEWKGRVGWAPTHGEWQLLVTAIRVQLGEDAARRWLEGMKANQPRTYPNLISIVQGVSDGEVDVGFVNHYYVPRFVKERGEGFGARNHFFKPGDVGGLVDVSGAGVLKTSANPEAARKFVGYLLSKAAQEYFSTQTFEYPLVAGVTPPSGLPDMKTLDPPNIDPDKLGDLQGTLKLLREAGVLP